ncbi:hypothetical protein Tco_1172959 [Tanacetum coccineum]
MKKVNIFVDMDTELMEGSETREESSSTRAGDELEQEPSKKQKVDDDKETEELKQCMEIISDDGDDVTIEATPLSTKSVTIVDYKIYKEGKKIYLQIIKADDQVEPSNVPKPETVEPNVLASENINERRRTGQNKNTGHKQDLDEDSSDQEEDLNEDSSYQEEELKEDLHEDSSDQEEDLDEESGDQLEDLYEDSSDPEDLFYSEGISLWEEDNHNVDIVSNGVIVGEKVVDEIPNATVPVDDGCYWRRYAD